MLQAFTTAVDLRDAPSLRRVICSGEALPASLARSFRDASGCELHNLYGSTEAAIDVSAHECSDDEGERVPIGRPISNISLYILDPDLELTPAGVAGDLYIGGSDSRGAISTVPALPPTALFPVPSTRLAQDFIAPAM